MRRARTRAFDDVSYVQYESGTSDSTATVTALSVGSDRDHVAKIGFSIYDGIHRETAVSARQVFGAVSTTRIHYTNIYVLKRPDEPYPAWRALSDLICAYMYPLRNHGKLATHRPRPFNVAEAMGRSAFIILPYP